MLQLSLPVATRSPSIHSWKDWSGSGMQMPWWRLGQMSRSTIVPAAITYTGSFVSLLPRGAVGGWNAARSKLWVASYAQFDDELSY